MAGTAIIIEGLTAKTEVTYATDVTPAAADDAVRLAQGNRVWNVLRPGHHFENLRDDVASGTLLPVTPGIPRGRFVEMDFQIELQPKGTAYAAGTDIKGLSALLRACGMAEAVVVTPGSESIDYTFADSSHDSATIYGYGGGKLFKVVGCRGSWTVPIVPGELGMIRFQMQGLLLAAPTETVVPTITYLAQEAPADVNLAMTVGAFVPTHLVSGELRGGQVVQRLLSGNANGAANDGIAEIAISRHRPSLALTYHTVALSSYDPYADKVARTARTATFTRGDTQYKRLKLIGATTYVTDAQHTEDNEFTAWSVEYAITAMTSLTLD